MSLLPQLGFLPIVFAVIVIITGYLWFKLYGKGKAVPQYNLFDMIEKEEVSISMNENKEKVTVSLANPEHEHDLLRLGSCLGERVLGLHVIKVPMQTDLQGAKKAHEKVMKESKNHTAILKGHLPQKINKIIVPFGGGENARYALFLARKLAGKVNAKINLLRIINPESSEHDRKVVREEMNEVLNSIDQKCDISFEIKEKYSKLDTIIDEAQKYDIMFMGDSNERFRSSLLGNVPRKVALNVKTPLILVRRYRPISREGFISKLPFIKRKRKKAVKDQ